MKILVLVQNPLTFDERVKRQIIELQQCGHAIQVIGMLADPSDPGLKTIGNAPVAYVHYGRAFKGWDYLMWAFLAFRNKLVIRLIMKGWKSPSLYKAFVAPLNSLFLKKAREFSFDIVIGNDLNCGFSAMEIAKRRGCKYIYDAHEYYAGQSVHLNHNEVKAIQAVEKEVVLGASKLMTVSYEIAKKLNSNYEEKSWQVILNIPDCEVVQSVKPVEKKKIKVLYHTANLNLYGRNVKMLIDAFAFLDDRFQLNLIGNCNTTVKQELVEYLDTHIPGRYTLDKALPSKELMAFVATCDIGMVLNDPIGENTNVTIPNKIFEYMNSGLAIVSFPVLGTRFLFEEAQIGALTTTIDSKGLADAILKVAVNEDYILECKKNSIQLSLKKYNWQEEKKKYKELV